jgi:hypothetical protein
LELAPEPDGGATGKLEGGTARPAAERGGESNREGVTSGKTAAVRGRSRKAAIFSVNGRGIIVNSFCPERGVSTQLISVESPYVVAAVISVRVGDNLSD